MKRDKPPSGLDEWRRSDEWRQIGSRQARANLAAFRAAPRCGAKRKRDGQPCEQPVHGGRTRCRYHGGATPRGKDWHRPRWPSADSPDADQKLHRKLRDLQRAAEARRRRLSRMTTEERERHEAWKRAHQPGPPAARQAARERRRAAKAVRAMFGEPAGAPVSDEMQALDAARADLERRLRALQEQMTTADPADLGVFG